MEGDSVELRKDVHQYDCVEQYAKNECCHSLFLVWVSG
jgi:hypothetical protein